MNGNKKLPRDSAVFIELKEGFGGITGICPCRGFLEIYKANQTFRVQTPENIDPGRTNPNALSVATPTSDIGSKNPIPIVARVLLQGYEILEKASFQNEIDKQEVIMLLHGCKENLLICQKSATKVSIETNKIIYKMQTEGIPKGKNHRSLTSFPHVSDLIMECSTFLINAKHAIKSICELPAVFFAISERDNNFDSLASRLAPILNKDTPFMEFISSNAEEIKRIIELRNFQEHPKKLKKTMIENFFLTPDIKILEPQWYITGNKPLPIKEDMQHIIYFLLEMAESMLIFLVLEAVEKSIPYKIVEIESSRIDQDAPIKYQLIIDFKDLR